MNVIELLPLKVPSHHKYGDFIRIVQTFFHVLLNAILSQKLENTWFTIRLEDMQAFL